ncbi:MAG: hypothetical protein JJT95_05930 [Pararhodobacter sp.]|nr:hypothetical protein [Pararhodobacter sp.]
MSLIGLDDVTAFHCGFSLTHLGTSTLSGRSHHQRRDGTGAGQCSCGNAFSSIQFHGMVKQFQQDNEMRNIVMTDKDAREQATRHFFKRAQRQAQM